jgi:hypothetical protein
MKECCLIKGSGSGKGKGIKGNPGTPGLPKEQFEYNIILTLNAHIKNYSDQHPTTSGHLHRLYHLSGKQQQQLQRLYCRGIHQL